MDQFMDIKKEHPDTILFFRMGDFYELFHEDAVVGSEVLGLALTSRDKKADKPIQMAGFPWHGLEDNIRGMLKAGHKVTVAEQEQELREGAKLLERIVTRVYTPGSLYEESLLGTDERSLLISVVLGKSALGIGIVDASTGQAWASNLNGEDRFARALDEIMRWRPTEIVVSPQDAEDTALCALFSHLDSVLISQHRASESKRRKRLEKVLKVADLGHLDLDDSPLALAAAGLAADYLATMHIADEVPLRDIEVIDESGHLVLDQTTLRNLELTSTLAGEFEGSLLSTMNACRSSMGRRLLKTWILRPLCNLEAISARHEAVGSLARSARRLEGLREALRGLRDMERLATQLAYNRSNGRDLIAVCDALERMPAIINLCNETENPLLGHLSHELDALNELAEDIRHTLVDEPPLSVRDGKLIRPGLHSVIDELRETSASGHSWFSDLESKLRIELEIPSLKVRMNRQIGWFIEVTKLNETRVPEEWRRKQQMTNGSRYVTEELAQRDDLLLTADTKVKELEYREFISLRERCRIHAQELANIAGRVAAIDVLQCFASIARSRSWTRPELTDGHHLKAEGARHPALEMQSGFVPNDIQLQKKRNFLLITGPNMGGKSTYLRTTALLTILAQTGSFVPAKKARIGLVDRIFTRVGASDDLRRGRSTFMMEMIEVAHILRRATPQSLILLDEIGRGTSTFDGLSIAWSVTEDICKRIGARTLFATHYHQLIGLEGEVDGLVNVHVQVAQADGELRFLHTVADGPCDDSYGVQVAALAGLPRPVVERASDLLAFLEQQAHGAKAGESGTPSARAEGQSSLMGYFAAAAMNQKNATAQPVASIPSEEKETLEYLSNIDVDELSPRQAHEALYRLKRILGGVSDV
ncbi:MAG: DNA mismatch repair protein MutS [Candidatus Poseidoniaceae archaeon]|nr:DNA mismatch repair protein MutS [Candidatus Poseidoniaceae archaeon]